MIIIRWEDYNEFMVKFIGYEYISVSLGNSYISSPWSTFKEQETTQTEAKPEERKQ